MNAHAFLLFTVLTTLTAPVLGNINCPDGLPQALLLDCRAAERAGQSDESGPDYFGYDDYNVTENLQAWVDTQMQLDVARESTEPTGSDIAGHMEEN